MFKRRNSARDLAQIAIFAALIAALGLPGGLSIGSTAVPITFQTLGVMLTGAILGARKGFLAVLLFHVLTIAGLPLLSGGRGGISWYTTSPSAGYVYGWLIGVLFIGYFTAKILPNYALWAAFMITAIGGIVLIYAIGVPVTAANTGLPLWGAMVDALKFLPGDAIKVVVTVLVAKQVHSAYPGLMGIQQLRPTSPLVRVSDVPHPAPLGFWLGGAPNDLALTSRGRTLTYGAFTERVAGANLPTDGPVYAAHEDPLVTLTLAYAALAASRTVVVSDPSRAMVDVGTPPPNTFLIAVTSGSSGNPRPVARTAASWSESFDPLTRLAGLRPTDIVGLTGPLHATLHLFGAVHALWLGAHLTDQVTDATVVHCVPTVLAALLSSLPDAAPLRTAIVAGSALDAATTQRAADRGVAIVEYYGATELSFVAVRRAPEPLRAFPGVEIEVRDQLLWSRSSYQAIGYVGDICGPLRTDESGFATVGDLATLAETGELTIHGRADAAITTGGTTVIAEDVEAVLMSLPGIRVAVVIGRPHPRLGQIVVAVLELVDGTDPAEVRAAARRLLGPEAMPRRWFQVASLPRTPAGKIARAQVADVLADGSLSAQKLA